MSAAPKHAPPKKIHGVTGRYASAVYTAASKVDMLDKVEGELQAFSAVLAKNEALTTFMENPAVSRGQKQTQLDAMLDEKKFSHITRNLLMTMAANGRIKEAGKVIGAYEELMQAARGSVDVTIISAETLKKKQLDAITSGVMSMVGSGKQVNITNKIDASILGGLQVMIGDTFLDLSVNSRVIDLSATLDAKA
jgi:F-type H+-transporting ATPase subunit O